MTESEFEVHLNALPLWNDNMGKYFPKEIDGKRCVFTGWKLDQDFNDMRCGIKSSCLRAQAAMQLNGKMFLYADASGSKGTLRHGDVIPEGDNPLPVVGASFSDLLDLARILWKSMTSMYEAEYKNRDTVPDVRREEGYTRV